MHPLITLTTDFGLEEGYVAAMKGVILGINPEATIVDLCHLIAPQDLLQAAFVLDTTYPYFPEGTLHVVVVDPGVGTGRRAVALATPRATFLAPDNGVLSYVLEREGEPWEEPPRATALSLAMKERPLVPVLRAVALTNSRYWLKSQSATFHGRDLFAPVAAHLSLGLPLEELGAEIGSLLAFPIPRPEPRPGGGILCHILHIDRFGDLITDARREDLPEGRLLVEVAGRYIQGLSSSYAEGGDLLTIIGSAGYLEVAAKNASAADLLGAKVGDTVRLSTY